MNNNILFILPPDGCIIPNIILHDHDQRLLWLRIGRGSNGIPNTENLYV